MYSEDLVSMIRIKLPHSTSLMIDIKYQLKLSFIKHPIRNKLKGFPGLSLVDNYQHLIKLKGFHGLFKNL
jgi:hypothetical protein